MSCIILFYSYYITCHIANIHIQVFIWVFQSFSLIFCLENILTHQFFVRGFLPCLPTFPYFPGIVSIFPQDLPRTSHCVQVPAEIPGRVLELCRRLAEAQRVERELRRAEAAEGKPGGVVGVGAVESPAIDVGVSIGGSPK